MLKVKSFKLVKDRMEFYTQPTFLIPQFKVLSNAENISFGCVRAEYPTSGVPKLFTPLLKMSISNFLIRGESEFIYYE